MLPIDLSGQSLINKIENEYHALKAVTYPAKNVVVPNKSPFYADNFVVHHIGADGVESTLVRGQHFVFANMNNEASIVSKKQVFEQLIIIDPLITGTLRFVSYQAFGDTTGPAMQEVILNSRKMIGGELKIDTLYENIKHQPTAFEPTEHVPSISGFTGFSGLNTSVAAATVSADVNVPMDLPIFGDSNLVAGNDINMQNRLLNYAVAEAGSVTKDSNGNLTIQTPGTIGKSIWVKDKLGHVSAGFVKEQIDAKNAANAAQAQSTTPELSNKVGTVVTTMDKSASNALAANPSKWLKLTSAIQVLPRTTNPELAATLPSPAQFAVKDYFSNGRVTNSSSSCTMAAVSKTTGTLVYGVFDTTGDYLVRVANLEADTPTVNTVAWPLSQKTSNNINIQCVKGVFFVYNKWLVYVSKDDGVTWSSYATTVPATLTPNGFDYYGYYNSYMFYDNKNDKAYFILSSGYYSQSQTDMSNKVYVSELVLATNTFTNYVYSNSTHAYTNYGGGFVFNGKLIIPFITSVTINASGFKLRYKNAPFSTPIFIDCIFPSDYTNTDIPWLYDPYFFEYNGKLYVTVTKKGADGISYYTLLESTDGITYTRSSFTFDNAALGGDMGTTNWNNINFYEDSNYKIIYFYKQSAGGDYMFISYKGGAFKKVKITMAQAYGGTAAPWQSIMVNPDTDQIYLTRANATNSSYKEVWYTNDKGDTWTKFNSNSSDNNFSQSWDYFYNGYVVNCRYLSGGAGGQLMALDVGSNTWSYVSNNAYDSTGTIVVNASSLIIDSKLSRYSFSLGNQVQYSAYLPTINGKYMYFIRDAGKTIQRHALIVTPNTNYAVPKKFTPASTSDTYSPDQYIRIAT